MRQEVLDTMLEPYYPECRYIVDADLNYPAIESKMTIPTTFYGEQSGHFNATEMMMCYNQLAFTFFAESFDRGLIDSVGRIPLEEFIEYQMGRCFIVGMDKIRFKDTINPKKFYGNVTLEESARIKKDLLILKTGFSFYDNDQSRFKEKFLGKVDLAVKLKPGQE